MVAFRSFDDVRETLLEVADYATDVAGRPAMFAEDSTTRRDFCCDAYTMESFPELGFQVTLKAARSLALSADMVRGMAELSPTSNVIFSRIALIRPAVVAAARTKYLTDPSIDTRERVRRWANMTIESRVEEANCFPAGGPERARLEKDLLEFDKLASQLGEQVILDRQRFGLVRRRSIGKSLSEMALVKAISGASDGDYSLLMYRLASSILHDNDHGQLMHYRPGEVAPDVPLDELTMPMQFDVQAAGLWFGSTAMTMIDALHDFTQHQGGDTEDVVRVMRLIGGAVRELLEERRAAGG